MSLDANSIEQKYDPKVGFFLRSKNVTALSGKFVCSGTYRNETEVVEITVAPPTGKKSREEVFLCMKLYYICFTL